MEDGKLSNQAFVAKHFHPAMLSEKFGGLEMTQKVCQIFLDESPTLIKQFHSLDPLDLASLSRSAHRLKGTLGMLGADSLTLLASDLSIASRNGESSKALTLHRDLSEGLDELRIEIETFLTQG